MEHVDDDGGYETCILRFDTNDSEFCRGVELGLMWATLQHNPNGAVEHTVHSTNTEMALRVAESLDRPVTGEVLSDDWTHLTFGPVRS